MPAARASLLRRTADDGVLGLGGDVIWDGRIDGMLRHVAIARVRGFKSLWDCPIGLSGLFGGMADLAGSGGSSARLETVMHKVL